MNPKYRTADLFELNSDKSFKMEIHEIVYDSVTRYRKTGKVEYSGFEGYLCYTFDSKELVLITEEEINEKYKFLTNSFDN